MNYLKIRNKYIPDKVADIGIEFKTIKSKIKNNTNMIDKFRIEPLLQTYYKLLA